jgi:Tol biopolymer transport system component
VEARTPVTAGWLRPVILLPPAVLLGLTPEQLEAVLAHELAHVRRHDFLVNVLQRVVEVLLFYHPAVWWLSGLVRVERELCCDDVVVATCGHPTTHARALTELEALRVRPPEAALAVARGPVLSRARRLVQAVEADRRPASWSTLALPALALAAIALISSVAPLRGEPYVNGSLIYQESATGWEGRYWERSGHVARVVSGRAQWRLKEPAPVSFLQYSPRGDEVVLPAPNGFTPDASYKAGSAHLWKARLDNSGRPDLTRVVDLSAQVGNGHGESRWPQWSPDGTRILFLYVPPAKVPGHTESVSQLWMMDADGLQARPIRVPGRVVERGQWMPDGSRLLLSTAVLSPAGVIPCRHDCRTLLVDTAGRRLRELRFSSAVASPDGRSIVGVRVSPAHGVLPAKNEKGWYHPTTGTYHWEVVLANPDTGQEHILLSRSYPNAELPDDPCSTAAALLPHEFAWSPDSRQIAFVSAMEWDRRGSASKQVELFIYDLSSGGLTQMTHDDLEQLTPVSME